MCWEFWGRRSSQIGEIFPLLISHVGILGWKYHRHTLDILANMDVGRFAAMVALVLDVFRDVSTEVA
jgi:hypothetical protein